ncbi:MAG: 2-amino-4-hydroxy-6-hydroxymethyldihydropteridine diphosphokinase [Pseudomonadota bacterium]
MPQDRVTSKHGEELPQYRSNPLIAVGSNRSFEGNDPTSLVRDAMQRVASHLGVIRAQSHLFLTPAFPPGAGPDFVNGAFSIETGAPVQDVLEVLHEVERSLGRQRAKRWEARTIDLDLIADGAAIVPDRDQFHYWQALSLDEQRSKTPDRLVLPHPRMHERAFVLVPLSEIAPQWRHPVLGKTVTEMLETLPEQDKEAVRRL